MSLPARAPITARAIASRRSAARAGARTAPRQCRAPEAGHGAGGRALDRRLPRTRGYASAIACNSGPFLTPSQPSARTDVTCQPEATASWSASAGSRSSSSRQASGWARVTRRGCRSPPEHGLHHPAPPGGGAVHLGMGREELIERLASREPVEQHPHSHTRSGEDGGAAVDLGVTKRTLALASAALLPKCRRRAGLLPAWPDPSAGAGPPAFEGEGGLRLSAPTPGHPPRLTWRRLPDRPAELRI